jgi:ArsR family transcriptional regulator
LSHQTRLDVFCFLVRYAPDGVAAGEIGTTLGVVQNTMSAHLGILNRASLIIPERNGRVIKYYADLKHIGALLQFLMQDCCEGTPQICQPLLDTVACSVAKGAAHA